MAKQTAIIIQHGDTEILVRVFDAHIEEEDVKVDTRLRYEYPATWQPYNMRLVEVRREGT